MSPYFRDMVHAIGDKDTPICGVKSLVYYINGEFSCLLKFRWKTCNRLFVPRCAVPCRLTWPPRGS